MGEGEGEGEKSFSPSALSFSLFSFPQKRLILRLRRLEKL